VKPVDLPWGAPAPERADAARNRQQLLASARTMLAEGGPDTITMDALAERSGLGKGTVFRRFGTRAGIFEALLDDDERAFQAQVLAGPPPLGPGGSPLDRLIAYGQARIRFLTEHREIARAALDGRRRIPAGAQTPLSWSHIRMLLAQIDRGPADLEILALQLTAALDGPLLFYLSATDLDRSPGKVGRQLDEGWQELVRRVCRPPA
jgi:AcrR family transcriptional regulator